MVIDTWRPARLVTKLRCWLAAVVAAAAAAVAVDNAALELRFDTSDVHSSPSSCPIVAVIKLFFLWL